MIGVVLGLSTLLFHSSVLFFTMRLAALAENMEFSLGGLYAVAVGLRRRCACADVEVEERRLSAEPILRASKPVHWSSSLELELPLPFIVDFGLDLLAEIVSTVLSDVEVLRMAFAPISRSGDVLSESEP